jgi:hypothetical protein
MLVQIRFILRFDEILVLDKAFILAPPATARPSRGVSH